MVEAFRQSEHKEYLEVVGRTVTCHRCGQTPSRTTLKHWLKTPCVSLISARGLLARPAPKPAPTPVPVIEDDTHSNTASQIPTAPPPPAKAGSGTIVGHREAHASHTLRFFDHCRVWACMRCGLYGGAHFRGLANPCLPRTRAGSDNLSRLQKGHYPGSSAQAKAFNAQFVRRRR